MLNRETAQLFRGRGRRRVRGRYLTANRELRTVNRELFGLDREGDSD
jgi:hypothetical protein